MITPEEQILLDNLKKAKDKAENTKALPCTPEAHSAVVDVVVQQSDIISLSYKKTDTLVDSVNTFMAKQAQPSIPATWAEAFRAFMIKSPMPFALIVLAVIFWFIYGDIKPKDILPIAEKEVVGMINK